MWEGGRGEGGSKEEKKRTRKEMEDDDDDDDEEESVKRWMKNEGEKEDGNNYTREKLI